LPASLKLLPMEWRFLICCDGKTPVEQIQQRLGLSPEEADGVVQRLSDSNLLSESVLSLEDFAKAGVDRPATGRQPQTLREHLADRENREESRVAEPPAFRPLEKPAPPSKAMSLQSVIQFILHHKSDPTAGQLATYQVFMGIGTPLLKRNGITSLRFQDDRIITDLELQTAIVESIQKVLNVNCSVSTFAPQPALKTA
jgi:hypothetical protein